MWKSNLRKENEFLKRLVAAILPPVDVCEICVFCGTLPNDCNMDVGCRDCESEQQKTCACCGCVENCNFLWNGKTTQ